MNHILFSLAYKNLTKNKTFSLINIAGLSVGITAFILIQFYIISEISFDEFNVDKDKIYRVESQFRLNGEITQDIATSSFGYAPAMIDEFPEIESACRINLFNHEKDVRFNEIVHREEHVFMVDSNFFSFFSYRLLQGNPKEVLARSDQVVLSEKAAYKYFKNENPVGKVLQIKDIKLLKNYTVSGVFKNIPSTSNVQFDILLAYDYASEFMNSYWYMHEAYLYVKVPEKASIAKIEKNFTAMSEKYKVDAAMKDQKWEITLVPLTQIHLNKAKPYELEQKGNSRSLDFLFIMAILILLIAWINFINLSTVTIIKNRYNYQIMKAQGANNKTIFIQFIANATLINLIALVLSIILLTVGTSILGNTFSVFNLSEFWSSPLTLVLLIGSFILGILITGIIPGLTLPFVKSNLSTKNSKGIRGIHLLIRKTLVITQYTLAIILIICTVMIRKQLNYMLDQKIGADINDVLSFKTPTKTGDYFEKMASFRDELTRISGVENVALSSVVPGQIVSYMGSHKRADAPVGSDRLFEMFRIDSRFIPLYNLNLIQGRNFFENDKADYRNVIINEKAVNWFGFKNNEDAIGKAVNLEGYSDRLFYIVGIVENYHQQSLKVDYTPIVYVTAGNKYWIPLRYFSVKSFKADKEELITNCRKAFHKYFPEAAFDYFFTNQYYYRQYETDYRFSSLFTALSWLSIIIVCIGILGLSGYIMELRTKEIGIRKVNGARTSEVLILLNKDFVKWVAISFVIACPIAWYAMHRWLQNFAGKTEQSWWIFALAGFLAMLIALITVSWQSWKTARRNPIESLRYE